MTATDARTVILHIGPPKTGSTAIQRALRGYDDGDTFTANFGRTLTGNSGISIYTAFHHNPVNNYHWSGRGYTADDLRLKKEDYRAAFSAMLKRRDRKRIIVSGEAIWFLDSADTAALVGFIQQHGWEVRVVAYLREPISWAASRLSQRAADFTSQIPDKLPSEYRRGLEPFAELLPPERLHVRPFGGDVVADFFRVFGIDLLRAGTRDDLSGRGETPRANESLSLPAMKLLLRFQGTGFPVRPDPGLYRARRQFAQTIREKYAGAGKLDPALCDGIADWSDTDWLYETFGVDFRQKAPARSTKADLEAVLGDLSDVDLSGLDELLAAYGVRHENFTTAEHKLHRLFHAAVAEAAVEKAAERGAAFLFKNPGRNLLKSFRYRALKHLSKYRVFSADRRDALARKAQEVRERWLAKG